MKYKDEIKSAVLINCPVGMIKAIRKKFKVTGPTVTYSLRYMTNSIMAQKIRQYALDNGAVICGNDKFIVPMHIRIIFNGNKEEAKRISQMYERYDSIVDINDNVFAYEYSNLTFAINNMVKAWETLKKMDNFDFKEDVCNNDKTIFRWHNVTVSLEITQL